ncbi:MAG: ATP-binding cassette domain-containing protein [Methanocorpusculum sp.]|nr:ATP-binding cassette domain-containing protein [Methanocorpusculum sp.]
MLSAVVVNTIIAQIIAMPATSVMQKTAPQASGAHTAPAPQDAIISLDDVSFTYSSGTEPALNHVSLKIRRGEFVVVNGPSGSGKTTFARAAAGILPHAYGGTLTGAISIDGKYADDYENVTALSEKVGMVFDDADAQLIFTTTEEEIMTGLETRDLSADEVTAKLDEIYQITCTGKLKDRAPHNLSGGQKQRVALAAALSRETPVLVLDEAASELDTKARRQVYTLLQALTEKGTAVILVEHMTKETLGFATRLIKIDAGRVVFDGEPFDEHDETAFAPLERTEHPQEVILSAEHLTHCFGEVKALDDVSLSFCKGEITAILGENGSGKTTLVKHLNGLLRPDCGIIRLRGEDICGKSVPEIAKTVGLVFQNPDTMLFANTCEKEILFGVKNIGGSLSPAEALAAVGLGGKAGMNPRHLSRGERQKLALACVMATNQEIVIMDEPTTGLDAKESFEIMRVLVSMRNAGKTILMITHTPALAERYADRVISMADGRVTGC